MSSFITLELYRSMIHGDVPRDVGAPVAALYRFASESGILSEGDALLIGDLQALSGCAGMTDADLPFHALMILMFDALNEGSLCVKLDPQFLRARLSGVGLSESLAMQILTDLPKWIAVIGGENDYKPLILREGSFGRMLYFQRLHASERALETRLKELLATPHRQLDLAQTRAVLKEVLVTNPAGGAQSPIVLNDGQRAALAVCLLNDFSIVSGGPGTGKTTLIATLLRCLVRSGVRAEEIHLAAPAGRAAARMTESLRRALKSVKANAADEALEKLEARTIHRTLGYRPSRNDFLFNANNPLEGQALIVDEASMIDAALMARLMSAVPPGMRVILVGDREQLPSVDAGAVLADLLPDSFENGAPPEISRAVKELVGVALPEPKRLLAAHGRAVVLSVQQRSAKGLQPFIAAVRAGDVSAVFKQSSSASVTWIDAAGMKVEAWRQRLREWVARDRPRWNEIVKQARETLDFDAPVSEQSRQMFEAGAELQRRSRILTLVHGGEWGCDTINAWLSLYAREELDPRAPREYFSGLPVLMTQNNYARRLYNGDTGVVLRDRLGRYRVVFESAGEWIFVPLDSLAGAWQPGFAMTVHKSQGSEFQQVMLCVPALRSSDSGERAKRLFSRELIYTGVTRAKEAVTICGAREGIELALGRRVERISGLVLGAVDETVQSMDPSEPVNSAAKDEEDTMPKPEPGMLF